MLLLSLLLAAAPVEPTPATAPAAPPAPKEKMICKKQVDTGSLVKGRRICMTQSQYRRQIEEAQRDTANLQVLNGAPASQ